VADVRSPQVHLAMPASLEISDPEQAHAIFRCAQEGLTHALRHARAQNLWIDMARNGGRVEVRVRDDGRGAPRGAPGSGLRGMRERLGEVGGGLEIDTAPGAGFRLTGWVPAREASA